MQQIIAIALLSIRNAFRSKIVLCLLSTLLVVIILLPLTIKGDGTVSGLIQILISYTLGMSGFILALTTLWAGSASISSEISNKTIQMTASKPVTKMQMWLGKWVGLNIMNAGILLMCSLATYGVLKWHLRPLLQQHPEWSSEVDQILSSREAWTSREDYRALANQHLHELLKTKPLPEGITRQDALQQLSQQIMIEQNTIRPSGQKKWEFNTLPAMQNPINVTVQYRLSSSHIDQDSVKSRWLIGTPDQPDLIEIQRETIPRTINQFAFTVDQQWANKKLIITYINAGESGSSLLFDHDNGLVVLIPRGGFIGNYIRANLILFGQLSFFAALGVSAGCLFSLPVASFVSMFLLLLIEMGSYIESIARTDIIYPWQATPENSMTWLAIIITLCFKMLALLMSPLIHDNVLNVVSTGRIVGYAWTFNGFILQGIVYSVIMGWIASYLLNRRELSLPTT